MAYSYVETQSARVNGSEVEERGQRALRAWDAYYSKSTINFESWSGTRDGAAYALGLLHEALFLGSPTSVESACAAVEQQIERLNELMDKPTPKPARNIGDVLDAESL